MASSTEVFISSYFSVISFTFSLTLSIHHFTEFIQSTTLLFITSVQLSVFS
ncbi:MAG: hypothetical protein LBC61_04880 [Candidatus Peribacteria bacterium]|nr:hypothetical protein [Candidatus Peribacteria bacterium]